VKIINCDLYDYKIIYSALHSFTQLLIKFKSLILVLLPTALSIWWDHVSIPKRTNAAKINSVKFDFFMSTEKNDRSQKVACLISLMSWFHNRKMGRGIPRNSFNSLQTNPFGLSPK